MSIVVTAANGKLGTKVIEQLLAKKTGEEVIAGVRDPAKGAKLGAKLSPGVIRAWTLLVTAVTAAVFFWRAYG